MQSKKISLITICLLFSFATFAGINRNDTDHWLKKSESNSLRATKPTTDIGDASSTPEVTPIGDGVWLMLGLGLTYGVCLFNKNRKFAE